MREPSTKMTTTTTTPTGQGGSSTTPPKNGSDNTSVDAKTQAASEAAKKEKKKLKRKQKRKDKKNNGNGNNNNNNTTKAKFDGLQTDGIMKGITISTGDNASMTTKYRIYKKQLSGYAASKGMEHYPSVITNMKPVDDKD